MEKETIDPKDQGKLSTPLSRAENMRELCRKHGIPTKNITEELIGETSIAFTNSPSPESKDKAETALHYRNQRKNS